MIYALLFSFIGYAFTAILMDDVFWGYRKWLTLLDAPDWLKKPLGLCPVCFTGQLTLWFSLPLLKFSYVGILSYIAVICINMIIVLILQKYVKGD
jgi:hypothetical protein